MPVFNRACLQKFLTGHRERILLTSLSHAGPGAVEWADLFPGWMA